MIAYENKVVCFIDVVGFGNFVNRSETTADSVHQILSEISRTIDAWSQTPITQNIGLQITQFSDSIIFSFRPEAHYFMIFSFFKELVVNMVLNHHLVMRGGITYGTVYHDQQFIFGPAMNRAYELESKLADTSRIIMDDSALSLRNDDGKTIRDYPGQFVFSFPETGFGYIDYIVDVYPYAIDRVQYYTTLRRIIENGLRMEDPKLQPRYAWMRDEYNRAQSNFPALEKL